MLFLFFFTLKISEYKLWQFEATDIQRNLEPQKEMNYLGSETCGTICKELTTAVHRKKAAGLSVRLMYMKVQIQNHN